MHEKLTGWSIYLLLICKVRVIINENLYFTGMNISGSKTNGK